MRIYIFPGYQVHFMEKNIFQLMCKSYLIEPINPPIKINQYINIALLIVVISA